jgi:p-aminobenzoyl-glutamate transporter AbgT
MLSILNWTGISTVFSLKLINLMNNSQMTGVFLVVSMFVICVLITVFNPSTIQNWTLASPTFVPLLMRANISPEFTQTIFVAADTVGKLFTPLYLYLFIMIGFLYKYDTQNEDISLFGTMRKMMPIVIWLAITWLLIIVGWNLLGFALGFGTPTTL